MSQATLDDSSFKAQADAILAFFSDRIETLGEETDIELDVEYSDGMLSVTLEDRRQFLFNRHGPSRQVWLSSPVSGAWHFAPAAGGGWFATRGGKALVEQVAEDLAGIVARPVAELARRLDPAADAAALPDRR